MQCGVISRRQAITCGITTGTIRRHLLSGRWQVVVPGIYAAFSGPLPRQAKLWAVVLKAGPEAALSHATAAELVGLIDDPARLVHVTVPDNRRMKRVDGIRVHVADRVREAAHPSRLPPQTRVEETVLDLGQIAHRPAEAASYVVIACARRLTTPARLRAAIDRRPRLRWRALLLEACAYACGGCQSLLETRYLRQVERAHGLPPAIRQIRVRSATGTTYDDARYPEYGVVVELDGRQHTEPRARRYDANRDNEHALRGLTVLRYDWMTVAFDACRVAREVGTLLRSRGWAGTPTRCLSCPPATP
jgi:hypothetical protein